MIQPVMASAFRLWAMARWSRGTGQTYGRSAPWPSEGRTSRSSRTRIAWLEPPYPPTCVAVRLGAPVAATIHKDFREVSRRGRWHRRLQALFETQRSGAVDIIALVL